MLENKLIQAIEEQRSLDRLADPLQHTVSGLLARAPRLADVLHGRAIGHPLHSALVAIPIGGWTVGLVLDLAGLFSRSARFHTAADIVTAVGLGGAGLAAVAGLADWSLTSGKARRVGLVHALLNTAVVGLYGVSMVSRVTGHRTFGVALSALGFGLVGVSGWLGGELAFRYGVGVRKVAVDPAQGGEAVRTSPVPAERKDAPPR
jgi:uncharacterized membrane protein